MQNSCMGAPDGEDLEKRRAMSTDWNERCFKAMENIQSQPNHNNDMQPTTAEQKLQLRMIADEVKAMTRELTAIATELRDEAKRLKKQIDALGKLKEKR